MAGWTTPPFAEVSLVALKIFLQQVMQKRNSREPLLAAKSDRFLGLTHQEQTSRCKLCGVLATLQPINSSLGGATEQYQLLGFTVSLRAPCPLQLWLRCLKKNAVELEKLQKQATKMIKGMEKLLQEERLQHFGQLSLAERQTWRCGT